MKQLFIYLGMLFLLVGVVSAAQFNITARDTATSQYINSFTAEISYYDPLNYSQYSPYVATPEGGLTTGNVTGYLNGTFYINVTKPSLAYGYTWGPVIGNGGASIQTYLPLTSACFNAHSTLVRLQFFSTQTGSNPTQIANHTEYCWNGTGWHTLNSTQSTGGSYSSPGASTSVLTNLYDNSNSTWIYHRSSAWYESQSVGSSVSIATYRETGGWWAAMNYTTITATTTTKNMSVNINATQANVTVTSAGYSPASVQNHVISGNYSANLTPNSLNLTFRDENTTALMNGTNVTVTITGSGYFYSNTTTTGSLALSAVPSNTTLTIIYSATGYNQRTYYTTLSNGTSSISLFLRTTASSSTLLIQVQNQALTRVAGAYVNQTVKNGTGYYVTEICQTDSNGQCVMTADISTSTYRAVTTYNFEVYFNGSFVGQSGDTIVATTASSACNSALPCLQLVVTIGEGALDTFFDIPKIGYTFTNSSANTFTFTLVDVNNIVSQVCLRSYMVTGAISTQTNSSCVSASNGSLTVTSNTSLGDRTDFIGSVVVNGQTLHIDTKTVPNNTSGAGGNLLFLLLGGVGVFLTVLFAYKGNASLALVMAAICIDILFLVSSLPGLVKGVVVAITLLILLVVSRLKE